MSDSEDFSLAVIVKTVALGRADTSQRRIQSPETQPHKNSRLIFDKCI